MRSKITAIALSTVLVLGALACSDDGGDDDEASSAAAGETTTTTEGGLGTEACDAVLGVGAALTNGPEGPPTPEYLEGEVQPAIDAVVASGTESLQDPADDLQAALDAALEGEDSQEAAFGAYGAMAAEAHTGCGYEAVDVSAVNYAFVDLPATLPAGTASFSLTNEADEDHELVLLRKGDGETRTAEELLALPQEEAETLVSFEGVTFAGPGETGYVAAELEPGAYFTVCFLPVGGGEEGPPHFTEGMVAEFEVT